MVFVKFSFSFPPIPFLNVYEIQNNKRRIAELFNIKDKTDYEKLICCVSLKKFLSSEIDAYLRTYLENVLKKRNYKQQHFCTIFNC